MPPRRTAAEPRLDSHDGNVVDNLQVVEKTVAVGDNLKVAHARTGHGNFGFWHTFFPSSTSSGLLRAKKRNCLIYKS